MIWSFDQQRMLAAMGYGLLRQHGAAPHAAPTAASRVVAEPHALPAAAAPGPFERLLSALQRSAGGSIEGLELPPLDRLRTDPAAKRALWPCLRARRRFNRAHP